MLSPKPIVPSSILDLRRLSRAFVPALKLLIVFLVALDFVANEGVAFEAVAFGVSTAADPRSV